jgi:hypothetical protein
MDQNLLTALSIGALDQADQDPRDRALRLCIRTMTDENCVAALAMKRGESVDFTGNRRRHIADRDAALGRNT